MAMQAENKNFQYDLIVIGGGSGGLAASKEAMNCGAKRVAVFDYVVPTVHGTKWGLGGTCVNVGCVPKKLMHYAASLVPKLDHDAKELGVFSGEIGSHNWTQLIETLQAHVKRLNFSYRIGLKRKGVEYINAMAKIESPHSVSYEDKSNKNIILTTKYILIAVGGRPHIPPESEVPGAATFAISSDDLFSWPKSPGKTLVVGASYIGLECAGALTELGYPTTVAVRSILLRSFDRQCADKIGELMQDIGTRFVNSLPSKIEFTENKSLLVTFENKSILPEHFDTVIYAIGRKAETKYLNLTAVGVKMDFLGKIIATDEQSSVPSIFAIGDALHGRQELTPVAIRAGELLARRLFANSKVYMDWNMVPTTVFTPFEYGCVGMSEEAAIETYGSENIEVFLYEFTSLELAAVHRPKVESRRTSECDTQLSPNSLAKLICLKSANNKIIGFHFVGMNAGEITQGYVLAIRLGATKEDFDATIGIHPTDAEAFHSLTITRRSGESWIATGGCGGGKCG